MGRGKNMDNNVLTVKYSAIKTDLYNLPKEELNNLVKAYISDSLAKEIVKRYDPVIKCSHFHANVTEYELTLAILSVNRYKELLKKEHILAKLNREI